MVRKQKTVKGDPFVKYEKALERAKREGRIDGPCKCLYCGSRYLSQEDADDCCKLR